MAPPGALRNLQQDLVEVVQMGCTPADLVL